MQEANHIKGRKVSLLKPPLLPTSWEGSFQTRVPLAAAPLHNCIAPAEPRHLWRTAAAWLPLPDLAPSPRMATLQYTLAVASSQSGSSGKRGLQMRTLGLHGPEAWPEEHISRIDLRQLPLRLRLVLRDVTEERTIKRAKALEADAHAHHADALACDM